ncbi:MAG: aminotransferase class I/II-fold pyridoxal phosphate-dependent enzyme [Dehalococcoidia bacterium]|nr:aminotransferase class I/II-fold pyridoxal phosphate-dependent enzyme [Dehalococcoidia bacterium]
MDKLDSQAVEVNDIIKKSNSAVYDLLSKRGRAIYFPAKGILAQSAAAKGKELNATIGTACEDDGKPMVIPSIASLFGIDSKDAFPYAPSQGIQPLRNKWQALIRSKNPSLGTLDISLPVVTCGVTNGLSIIGYMFLDEGDSVILSDLYWENYDLAFANAYGAEFDFFNLFHGQGFDSASFKKAVMGKHAGKRVVILNFPNNPTGYTPTKQEAEEIIAILQEAAVAGNKLVVVLDDSYFGLVYEENVITESLFPRLVHAHENLLAVKTDGMTKEEYAWGLRVGFITYGVKNGSKELYQALESKTAGAIRGNISNSSHPAQSAFLHALNSADYAAEKRNNYQKMKERYLKVKEVLGKHDNYSRYFQAEPFNSGYFMCVRLKDLDADKVWELLLTKYSTGVICYSKERLFRIAFASTPLDKIEKLFDNIYLACKECAG